MKRHLASDKDSGKTPKQRVLDNACKYRCSKLVLKLLDCAPLLGSHASQVLFLSTPMFGCGRPGSLGDGCDSKDRDPVRIPDGKVGHAK
jgi:hypothetical protein